MKMRGRMVCFFMSLWMVFTFIPVTTSSAAYEGETLESVYEEGSEGETKYTPAVMPGSATASARAATASFNTNYSLSGNSADKMVSIATAQVGRSRSTMGYSDSWCARFVSDVASKAGESAAIPYNAGCRQLYNAIISAGGKEVSTPQKGDIVFFVCTVCKVYPYNNAYSHVGIMVDSSGTCISGNYNGKVSQHKVGDYQESDGHSVATRNIILKYVRPNYSLSSSANFVTPEKPQNAVKFYTWISEQGKGVSAENATSVSKLEKGNLYYFWFYLREDITHKKVPDSYPAVQVSVKMTITDPNGKSQSTEYKNSSDNWFGFIPTIDGTYTFTAAVSGDYEGTRTIQRTISTSSQVSVETLNTLNSTGTASLYPTVFKGYLRGTSKYNAYSDSSGSNYIGRIYTTDELKVQSVYANNGTLWMSALCPWDGYASDRLIYAKLDAVVDTSFAPYTAIASSSATVYTRSNASAKYGSLGKGDAVTVVGQSGQYSQVIYPLAVGGYKIGWCATASLSRPDISSVTAVSSTSLRLAYTLPSNAANNLVILDAGMNVLLRGSIRGSGGTVTRLTPGVTYYIYIESELSNGTGTVTSMVKKVVLK